MEEKDLVKVAVKCGGLLVGSISLKKIKIHSCRWS